MKKFAYLIILAVLSSLSIACTDSELQNKLNGKWVAQMDAVNEDTCSSEATITLSLNASDMTDTLSIHVPSNKGMLVYYKFDGTWSAVKDQLTLDLNNKLLQSHADNVNRQLSQIAESHPEFDTIQNYDNLSNTSRYLYRMYSEHKCEQNLLDALRKNVGCRSTMNIIELTDSTLVIGDNQSKINFKRVK